MGKVQRQATRIISGAISRQFRESQLASKTETDANLAPCMDESFQYGGNISCEKQNCEYKLRCRYSSAYAEAMRKKQEERPAPESEF